MRRPRAPRDPAAEVPTASSRDYAIVHYKRTDGDYTDWRLYAWGDLADGESTTWPAGHDFIGRDAYGAFAYVKLKPGASSVGFLVIDKDGNKDVATDRTIDVTKTGEVWVEQGKEAVQTQRPDYPAQDTTKAVLHYHRADGDYSGWGLHVWTGAATPTDWSKPLEPVRTDAYGAVFEVPLAAGATSLSYILHKGDEKRPPDRPVARPHRERPRGAGERAGEVPAPAARGQRGRARPDHLQGGLDRPEHGCLERLRGRGLHPVAVLPRRLDRRQGRDADQRRRAVAPAFPGPPSPTPRRPPSPYLKDYTAWSVDPRDRSRVKKALNGQVVGLATGRERRRARGDRMQIAGVLDDLYDATKAQLGPTFRDGRPTLAVWAPTAQSVALELDGSTVAMKRNDTTGVWSVTGAKSWRNKPYRYVVKVWAPTVRKVVTNKVTDPYSLALTADSERSLVVDLKDRSSPSGWSSLKKPKAVPLRDAQIQELHIRDFSVADKTVPAKDRGTYLAFTDKNSDGSRHLRPSPRRAPRTSTSCPPSTSPPSPRRSPQATTGCDLASYPPDSRSSRSASPRSPRRTPTTGATTRTARSPEGSYASDPDGTGRTVEFRRMVKSLNEDGLRVVMDVVYNHTAASGQADTSVLDRIVPGYYQRLLADGSVATSTCCANTATENAMMGKLVVDSIVTWAKEYKVDGFRFDLIGHPPQGQHPGRSQGPRRADPGEGRVNRKEDHPVRGGLELR